METLDKCFENVCELDLIFHVDKVLFTILSSILNFLFRKSVDLCLLEWNAIKCTKLEEFLPRRGNDVGGVGGDMVASACVSVIEGTRI